MLYACTLEPFGEARALSASYAIVLIHTFTKINDYTVDNPTLWPQLQGVGGRSCDGQRHGITFVRAEVGQGGCATPVLRIVCQCFSLPSLPDLRHAF